MHQTGVKDSVSKFPKKVTLVEVSPRDGLQNEKQTIPLAVKVELINRLADAGLSVIEAGSFVSPKWVPQLADTKEVLAEIEKHANVSYPVLVPNLRGFENALAAGVKEIAVFTTPSEEFSQKNTNCSVAESVERVSQVINAAHANDITVRGYLSCVLGCPYSGEMDPAKVASLAKTIVDMGCVEVSLGDTIGVGTPVKTQTMLKAVSAEVPIEKLAVHFHDTYGQALANIYAALEMGVATIDSSVAGIGGCPYAKGASGNVATEDVLFMLQGMGIETGVDMQKLIAAGRFISDQLQRAPMSKVNRALGG